MVSPHKAPEARFGAGLAAWLGAATPALVTAGVALGLAVSAMLPGVDFWDTAEFQTVGPVMGTAHPTGYPTYVILGWLVNILLTPFGEPAFRMNLFAGLSVATAAGLTVVLLRRMTGRWAVAMAAGIGLAASPLAWRIGTHAEPHSLHLALVALLLVLLVGWELARREGAARADRWLVAASVAFGLAAGNHSLTLLLAPAIGVYVLAVEPGIVRRPRLIAACTAALAGTLVVVYLELPIRAGLLPAPLAYGRPDTWQGFWYIAMAQQFQGAVSNPLDDLPRKAGDLAALASQQLGVLALLVPAALVVTIHRFPRYALLTILATLITALFSASYLNADISRYYLGPLLMAWTWLGILAASAIDLVIDLSRLPQLEPAADWRFDGQPDASPDGGTADPGAGGDAQPEGTQPRAATSRRAPGALVSSGLAVLVATLLVLPSAGAIPARHRLVDERGNHSAAIWLDAALERIAHNAVVVSWWSYSTPLWYAQKVEGRRTDVFVVDDRTRLDLNLGEATDVIATYLGERPVYVIRANQHDLDLVTALYKVRAGTGPAANVYEVVAPVKPGS